VPTTDPFAAPTRRRPANIEIVSPLRPPGYQPPVRRYEEIADGHFVMRDAG